MPPKAKRKASSSSTRTIEVDFTDVQDSKFTYTPDAAYSVEVSTIKKVTNENDNDLLDCRYKITEGSLKGNSIPDKIYLTKASLWRFGNFLRTIGKKVEKRVMNIDYQSLVGCKLIVMVQNEKNQGKPFPKVIEYIVASSTTSSTEDKRRTPTKKKVEEEKVELGNPVTFEEDGELYNGKVIEIKGKDVTVLLDGSEDDEWEMLITDVKLKK